jgi:hypothetical protein
MGYRKDYRHQSKDPRSLIVARGPQSRCVICQEIFDSPTLSLRMGKKKDRAHLLCAALSRVGLGNLAKTSGRW